MIRMFNLRDKKLRQKLKWAAIGLIIISLVPAVQVGCVRVFDPPTTGPIVVRWLRGKITGHNPSPATRYNIPLDDAPNVFLKSLWMSEDSTFFKHHGFNWKAIQAAWEESRATGKRPRGASTITQQCARSVFLWQGRSWVRKGLEAYYTVWMELLLSKERILELYINAIELGDGVYGVEAGARYHYGIHASELNAEQAAMLVAILPNPRQLNPKAPSQGTLERQAKILSRLADNYGPLLKNDANGKK